MRMELRVSGRKLSLGERETRALVGICEFPPFAKSARRMGHPDRRLERKTKGAPPATVHLWGDRSGGNQERNSAARMCVYSVGGHMTKARRFGGEAFLATIISKGKRSFFLTFFAPTTLIWWVAACICRKTELGRLDRGLWGVLVIVGWGVASFAVCAVVIYFCTLWAWHYLENRFVKRTRPK
jgi:hypothetical protein